MCIICFGWKSSPLTGNPPIQFIENNIGQQWTEDAALRYALCRHTLTLDGRFQHFGQNAQQLLVPYAQRPELFQQLAMVYVVKEAP